LDQDKGANKKIKNTTQCLPVIKGKSHFLEQFWIPQMIYFWCIGKQVGTGTLLL